MYSLISILAIFLSSGVSFRRKNPATPPHYRGELRVYFTGYLESDKAELSCGTPHLPVVQLLHSSADPGQITLNVYISHICTNKTVVLNSYKNYISLKSSVKYKNSEQLNLDTVSWSPRSNMT